MKNLYLCYALLVISLSLLTTETKAQWIQCNGVYGGDIRCITFLDTSLFIGTYGDGVFFSTNNGTSWNASENGLTNTDINAFVVSGMNLFAGTNGGVFLSTNKGKSWSEVSAGLTSTDVRSLAVSGTNLFAGTALMFGLLLSLARISLPGLGAAAFFFPPTAGQVGLPRVPV